MQNQYSDNEAAEYISKYLAKGFNEDIALRVYTSRLLGRNRALVLHGGGNTSVKTTALDILGNTLKVLCVKGSGWDMAEIEPAGLPAVGLEALVKTQNLDTFSDEAMVSYQRSHLLDFQAPNPSIETLLHAFLPHKFIDHTHANAILSITNQKNAIEICNTIYGTKLGIVPYIMPGFLLAKKAQEIYEQDPSVEGLILLNHGIFTFGESAKIAYSRMIHYVSLAEEYIANIATNAKIKKVSLKSIAVSQAQLAPVIRGICGGFILSFRTSPQILEYLSGDDLPRYSQTGVVTPDHIIRTKNYPLLLPELHTSDIAEVKLIVQKALDSYVARYEEYFKKYNKSGSKTQLDSYPRVVLVPGLGLFALGSNPKEANVVADIAENTILTISDAQAIGEYKCLGEADLFDIEYWSLEQAKLKSTKSLPVTGKVAMVTGAAGTIGQAIAKLFLEQGAAVALIDLQEIKLNGACLSIVCDVCNPDDVAIAFEKTIQAFGGVDILVSNAGAAWQQEIGTIDQSIMRKSFELNFFSHQAFAAHAVQVFMRQGKGGNLLFNVSKQAVEPGKKFGPYGIPKAATMALVKQYALEYGEFGIRSNAVNADRIRSGLLNDEMIKDRSKARDVDEKTYMAGNLLKKEVKAQDVAKAFLYLLLSEKTTAHVMSVDGGNIAASLR